MLNKIIYYGLFWLGIILIIYGIYESIFGIMLFSNEELIPDWKYLWYTAVGIVYQVVCHFSKIYLIGDDDDDD